MLLLQNQIRDYAWGATDGLAQLVGTAPSGGPEAELWVGTHPGAPSLVVDDPDGRSLAQVIAADPARWLGPALAEAGHTALPFLLKVLAIGQPLSLQAHPSPSEAQAGFAREEAAGVPLGAVERNYKDASAKPEALVAITPTWALCGFRNPVEAANLLAGLGIASLDPLVEALASGGEPGLATVLGWLLRLDGSERAGVAESVAAAVSRVRGEDLEDPRSWVKRLTETFPGDPTAVAPLLLNVVHLGPGESVHLPAGNLHAYLDGAGIEIMSASDNVLRGGLTPKHIDVDELLSVLRFESGIPDRPLTTARGDGTTTYDCGEDSFALVSIDPAHGPVAIRPIGPSLLLGVGGAVTVTGADGELVLAHGAAAFLAPGSGPYEVGGQGRAWWGTTGDGLPR